MRTIGLALGALLLLPVSQAAATDCSGVSLEGTWRYFSINILGEGDETVGAVEDCHFRVGGDGTIESAHCEDDDFPANEEEFQGEQIRVERSCGLKLDTVACEYVGQVEVSADAAHGVAFCGNVDRLSFDLVRD